MSEPEPASCITKDVVWILLEQPFGKFSVQDGIMYILRPVELLWESGKKTILLSVNWTDASVE